MSWTILAAVVASALPVGMVVASAGRTSAELGEANMLVELDLFSGRPNPSWQLTPAQGDEMRAFVRSLPYARGRSATAPGLGYRGLKVHDRGEPLWSLYVFDGIVEVRGSGRTEIRRDDGRRFERWLIGTAGAELAEGIRSRVPLE